MSLTAYKKKRAFDKTPEPSGKQNSSSKPLRFVVQKHHASHLHYDFRLEMEGVLKSWAVPKGPSMNPKDKRLAMMVEDHPYDYRNFEGIIPKGNYGAGTVIIWDEGTYEPAEKAASDKKQQEKLLLHQLHKGDLRIHLKGKKLKGEFALVHTNDRNGDNAWLLIKKGDTYASESDITKQDKSVVSGLSLEHVAKTSTNEWVSNRPVTNKSDNTAKTLKQGAVKDDVKDINQEIKIGDKTSFPEKIKPMLATLVKESFDDDDWLFEVKWDGYRAIASMQNEEVELDSRNKISFKNKFTPVTEALKNWNLNAVVDGEIIAINEKGVPDFQQLQSWQKTGKGNLVYYVYDLLWMDGYSMMNLPLRKRKEILSKLVPEEGLIRYSDHIEERGKDFYELALQEGLEGIMAKRGIVHTDLG